MSAPSNSSSWSVVIAAALGGTVVMVMLALFSFMTLQKTPHTIERSLGILHTKGIGRYYSDPVTKEIKPANGTLLLPDGVLFEKRLGRAKRGVCDYFRRPQPGDPPITRLHYHMEDCLEPQLGNRIGEIYGRMLIANAHQVPFTMTCGKPEEGAEQVLVVRALEKQVSTVKLLQMNETVPGSVPHDTETGKAYNAKDVCTICSPAPSWRCKNGLDMVSDKIIQDMWRIAQTDIGQSFEPDDAVIHLRLGDALSSHHDTDEGIGLLPHRAYSQILQEVQRTKGLITTISLITMPFTRDDVRAYERHLIDRSKLVAEDLQSYLAKEFPRAKVEIHNGHSEIPAKAYARLTRAKKVAVCGSSTFCTYPVLAVREAIGYIFRAEKHSPWAVRAATKYDNIRTYKVPRLTNNYTCKLSDTDLLMWLREQDPNVGGLVVNGPPLIRVSKNLVAE